MSVITTNFQSLLYLTKVNGIASASNWFRVRSNEYLTNYSDLQCSALAGFDISQRLRRELLGLEKELKIGDIFNILRWGIVNVKSKKLWSTEEKQRELATACIQFLEMENTLNYHVRPISESIAWTIPDSKFRDDGSLNTEFRRYANITVNDYFDGELEDWENWLPWMSLSISRRLKTWKAPKISCIDRALFKLPMFVGIESDYSEPWVSEYPDVLSNLPMPVLYQCERDTKTLDVILKLTEIGLKKVNDLKVFHPEAIRFAKDIRVPNTHFYNLFNS